MPDGDEIAARMLPGHLMCAHLELDAWLRDGRRSVDDPTEEAPVTLPRSLPVPPRLFHVAMAAWVRDTGFRGGVAPGGQPEASGVWFSAASQPGKAPRVAALSIGFSTRTTIWQSWEHMLPQWSYWHTWLASRLETAPPGLQDGFLASEMGWSIMQTQHLLVQTAWASTILSVALAFCILLMATRSLPVAAVASACIGGVVLLFLGFMVAAGWRLNMIESVCMTLLVGCSVDYIVHVAAAYVGCPEAEFEACASCADKNIEQSGESAISLRAAEAHTRARYALRAMGPPVLGGLITTVGASAFLWGARVVFFSQFGIFIAVTLAAAFGFATAVFPAAAVCLGLTGRDSLGACCRVCTRSATNADVDADL